MDAHGYNSAVYESSGQLHAPANLTVGKHLVGSLMGFGANMRNVENREKFFFPGNGTPIQRSLYLWLC
jgi:hypothetical protein